MKYYALILSILSLLGCKNKSPESTEIDLPFFNRPDFTPEWIDEGNEAYENIHTIKDFSFVNQNGDTVEQEDYNGKVYAANFFFSICPNVCPKMKKSLDLVAEKFDGNDQVRILSHTVMPWVDSVARLNEYALQNDIKSDQWNLVTGDKNTIYKLARESYFADEGFDKTVTSDEDFIHTENIFLIDQQRRIRGVYNGTLSLEMKRMIEDIETLLSDKKAP